MNVGGYRYKIWKYIPVCLAEPRGVSGSFPLHSLLLHTAKEALNNSIIPAVTLPAHATLDAMGLQ